MMSQLIKNIIETLKDQYHVRGGDLLLAKTQLINLEEGLGREPDLDEINSELAKLGITKNTTNEEVVAGLVNENLTLARALTGERSKRRFAIAKKIEGGFFNYKKRNREGD